MKPFQSPAAVKLTKKNDVCTLQGNECMLADTVATIHQSDPTLISPDEAVWLGQATVSSRDREAWTNGAEDALYVRHLGWSHIWVCVYQPRVNVGWDRQAVCHREATWFLKSLDPSHFYTTGLKHNDANNYSEVMLLRNVNVNVITGQWQVGEMDATIKKN